MTSLNDSAMRNIIGTLLLLLSGHAASALKVFRRFGSMGVGVVMDTWGAACSCGAGQAFGLQDSLRMAAAVCCGGTARERIAAEAYGCCSFTDFFVYSKLDRRSTRHSRSLLKMAWATLGCACRQHVTGQRCATNTDAP